MLQAPALPLHGGILFPDGLQLFRGHQPQAAADLGEPLVGVVLPVEQAVLGAGGHHPIGLVGALGDQVVDEHPDVPLVPAENQGLLSLNFQRGVDPGYKTLNGGLLIAGGAVELPRPVQAGDFFCLQGGPAPYRPGIFFVSRVSSSSVGSTQSYSMA